MACHDVLHGFAHARNHAINVQVRRGRLGPSSKILHEGVDGREHSSVLVHKPYFEKQRSSHTYGPLVAHVVMGSLSYELCWSRDCHMHTNVAIDKGIAEYEVMEEDAGIDPCKGSKMAPCKGSKNHLPWNSKVSLHVQRQQVRQAILVYSRMLQESILPDKSTYILLLSCRSSSPLLLRLAIQVHSLIPSLGNDMQSEIILENILISLYGRRGHFKWSQIVFYNLRERSVVSWNTMISLCVQQGQGQQALHLFNQMNQEGIMGNTITFISTLHAYSSISALRLGMHLHACIATRATIADVYLNTALVSMYAKCACIEKAEMLFEEMPSRNVVSWNTMISAYAQHRQGKRVVVLYYQLQKVALTPTVATFISIISTFSSSVDLLKGKQVHSLVVGELFDMNIGIGTALIGMYRRCGSISSAQSAFDAMMKHDEGSWNAMIAACVQAKKAEEAFQLFAHMQLQGVLPNKTTYSSILSTCSYKTALFDGIRLHALIVNGSLQKDLLVGNALVSMFGKCGALEKAQIVFDRMGERNTVSWNAMLDAHALHGKVDDLFKLFEQMRQDQVPPDIMTFTSMLTVCSRLGLVYEARDFLISMSKDFGLVPTRYHFNCVIDLLARAGKLDEAEAVLNNMPISYCAVSMRTLLGACRSQTDVERGERAARQVILMDPKSTSPYTILYGLYGVNGGEHAN